MAEAEPLLPACAAGAHPGWVSAAVREILGLGPPLEQMSDVSSSSSSKKRKAPAESGLTAPLRIAMPAKKVKDFRIKASWDGAENIYGVGSGVFVTSKHHPGCILLGKRLDGASSGHGMWALPGGHLEFGEEVVPAAERELLEETGLRPIGPSRVSCWHNAVDVPGHYHYLIAFVIVEVGQQEAVNTEPDKNEGWHWVKWDAAAGEFPPPERLFLGLRNVRERGYSPFEAHQGSPMV